jgi:multiple sugar transport system substrate-binding protein
MLSKQHARIKPGDIFLFGLLLILLSACGSPIPPPDPVTIEFAVAEYDLEHYQNLLADFQKEHPYITIEINDVSPQGLGNLSADDADAFAFTLDNLRGLQGEDGILGLTPFIVDDRAFNQDDFLPGTLDLLNQGGETWAVPAGANMFVLYYNRDFFEQAGLPYPTHNWRWDEFLGYAATLTNREATPLPVYGYTTVPGYMDSMAFVSTFGGSLFDNMQNPTHATLNHPQTVRALEFYADLFHEYQVAPTPYEARQNFNNSQFALYQGITTGNVGMWILPISERGGASWPMEWVSNWGMAALPQGASAQVPLWVDDVYAISAASEHPDEAWAWVSYLSRQMPSRIIPARRSLIASSDFEAYMGTEIVDVVRNSVPNAIPISVWGWAEHYRAIELYTAAVEDIVEGYETPQEALNLAQEKALE